MWAIGGAPVIDDATGNIYLMSGTDSGDQEWISAPPAYTQIGYNDAFLYLEPSTLALNDADLGSGSPVLD